MVHHIHAHLSQSTVPLPSGMLMSIIPDNASSCAKACAHAPGGTSDKCGMTTGDVQVDGRLLLSTCCLGVGLNRLPRASNRYPRNNWPSHMLFT